MRTSPRLLPARLFHPRNDNGSHSVSWSRSALAAVDGRTTARSPWFREISGLSGVWLALALAVSAVSASASLHWATTEQTVVVTAGAIEQKLTFPFVNEGRGPVTITKVVPSCGCTVPDAVGRSYPAGGSGEISVTVALEGAENSRTVNLEIHTDENDGKPDMLTIAVVVPPGVRAKAPDQPLAISPQFVFWRKGESSAPQTIALRVTGKPPRVRRVSVASDGENFSVELIPSEKSDPGLYRVVVTPLRTDRAGDATITVQTDYLPIDLPPGSRPLSYRLGAAIK